MRWQVSTDATESGESVDGHEERRGRGGGGAVLGGGERGERRAGPTLIVCPLSVLQNWQGQIKVRRVAYLAASARWECQAHRVSRDMWAVFGVSCAVFLARVLL